jgi:hypothetical protein
MTPTRTFTSQPGLPSSAIARGSMSSLDGFLVVQSWSTSLAWSRSVPRACAAPQSQAADSLFTVSASNAVLYVPGTFRSNLILMSSSSLAAENRSRLRIMTLS